MVAIFILYFYCNFYLAVLLFYFHFALLVDIWFFSCRSSRLAMLPPIPVLADYGISPEHGFLPPTTPLQALPNPYYAKWESIVSNLQALLLSRRLRSTIDSLPVLSTSYLRTDAEWRRAYVVLIFMLHGYIWGGDIPAEVRGPCI